MAKRWARYMVVAAIFLGQAPTAAAIPPTNDDFGSATVIGALPFTDSLDTSEATAAADDPRRCTNKGSVWYAFTPVEDTTLVADTFGSDYDTILSAYTGPRGALTLFPGACNNDSGGVQSQIGVDAAAGTTYYFLVALCCDFVGSGGGSLVFNVREVAPPSNDDFANATTIPGVPFTDTVDTLGATTEVGEPVPSCAFGGLPLTSSVWYAFTPAESGSVTASATGLPVSTASAVYTGSSLTNLTEKGCGQSTLVTFRAEAGTTYYLLAGGAFDARGSLQLSLAVAPDPVAGIAFFPPDPSIFDTIQFISASFDPGQADFESQVWTFGDGSTAEGFGPTHTYARDGNYSVRLTVRTVDGRTASSSQVVQVRTHDVAIAKVEAPRTAKSGTKRDIDVYVRNVRYRENVQVDLWKSTPGGAFELVGSLTHSVPAQQNMTTRFRFSYRFTNDDANMGEVTFTAIATIVGERDALPTDNEAISLPTKVRR